MNLRTAFLLALRTLLVRPRRTFVLLIGYGLGVAVMIALLAVGDALLLQARDRDLVAGGDLVLLPAGIDPEVLKTGAVTAMFLAIPNARFLVGQVLLGPRYRDSIAAASPEVIDKLIYVRASRGIYAARASGAIPSASVATRSALALATPEWSDTAGDQAWIAPSWPTRLEAIDRFHQPPGGVERRSWAEWWYFNFTTADGVFGYISFIADGRQRVRIGVAVRRPGRRAIQWEETRDRAALPFAGGVYQAASHRIVLRGGVYTIHLARPDFRADLVVRPVPGLYFPPVEWRHGAFRSGYVVPALRASVSGEIHAGGERIPINGTAYHDHNWGFWQAVTWEWGSASAPGVALLAGLIRHPALRANDMLVALYAGAGKDAGLLSMLRAGPPTRDDWREGPTVAAAGRRRPIRVPGRLRYRALNDAGDHLDVEVTAEEIAATPAGASVFLQIWGRYRIRGIAAGRPIDLTTRGFAETFVPLP